MNELRSHLFTVAAMAPFTPKPTSKLRSALNALHFRYSIVIPRFISRANTAQSIVTTIFITLLTTITRIFFFGNTVILA